MAIAYILKDNELVPINAVSVEDGIFTVVDGKVCIEVPDEDEEE